MRALAVVLSAMLFGAMIYRALVFNADVESFKAQIINAGPATPPSQDDLTARALAESVAESARVFGFTLSPEAVQVVRKPSREVTSEGKTKKVHDYDVKVTVSRWVLPLWTKTVTVNEATTAPCMGGHPGDGMDSFITTSRNP